MTLTFNGQLIDAQTKIFAVNNERATLIERIGKLEKQVTDLEAWETEKQRYELKEIAFGSFAYVVKPAMQGTEPPHQICANCYQQAKKSILQAVPRSKAHIDARMPKQLFCPRCDATFVTR